MTEDGTSLSVHSGPSEACACIGSFADDSMVTLTNDISHNGWYAVYGTTVEDVSINGWCRGNYLAKSVEYGTLVDVALLHVRVDTSTTSDPLGTIERGQSVQILHKNYRYTNNYRWHQILYNDSIGYVVAGNETPNFEFETRWVCLYDGDTSTDGEYITPEGGTEDSSSTTTTETSNEGNGIPAVKAIKDCFLRSCTEGDTLNYTSFLWRFNGDKVLVPKGSQLPLVNPNNISGGNYTSENITRDDWYQVLYEGMLGYVTADSFIKTTLSGFDLPSGNVSVKVMTGDGSNLAVHESPLENSACIGSLHNNSEAILMDENPQNGKWYPVSAISENGQRIYGWCLGDYLHKEIEVAILTDPTLSKITVRAIANAAGRAIGHIENGKYVPIIDKECAIGGAYTWHKVLYKGREGYVIVGNEAPNFDFETRWISLSSEKEMPQNANDPNENYSETQIESILTNIEGLDTSIVSDAHKETFKMVVRYMLYSKLEVAFIAGLLANIIGEGVFGQFEVSNGYPNIRYMDEEYGEKNFYTNNYSNKNITEVNVLAVRDILADLHDRSNGSFTIYGDPIGFGLGCIQWTGDRCYSLVKDYYLLYNNQSSSITKEQVEKAETEMLLGELQGDYYYRVYVAWRMDNSISDSQASARAAAQKICEEYIVPGSSTVVSMREKNAGLIYQQIIKNVL